VEFRNFGWFLKVLEFQKGLYNSRKDSGVDEKDRSHRKEWKVIGSPLTATV
jgi:hypothetical protein